MTEPLPCPFCGHVGVNVHEASTFRWIVAECDNCGAQCGEVRRNTMGPLTEEDEALAIAEWNARKESE
jgi:Lar family restriction alleviation protein